MIAVELEWAAVQELDGKPALSVMSRYSAGRIGDHVHYVIPLDALESFNPPLSIWQLIEVACEPAAEAQHRAAVRMGAADEKRARRRSKILRVNQPSPRDEQDAHLARMAGALH